MSDEAGVARLLPWSNEGKSCYLLGGGSGYVSRLADDMERVQLGMAGELLGHAADLLGDPRATPPQLRFLAARLPESLRDVHRIAESRGARLPLREGDAAGPNGRSEKDS
ncbi:hypothetical protein LIX60_13950 [Streptomyces sp. S07_1.15]|uniref:hypothetical protein n=1 Tax=Streptomyces sp. S07_1.15 TaxID=2873925 RepID=UPI001D1371F5|nr:hypothetical protein [Streptomyces sp. S07_1.15]MCC3652553.1 hypothetical protein [Streptomyces sp. S07_1.15]